MAHLFNSSEYFDYRSRVYGVIKKTIEGKLDFLTETIQSNLHPIQQHEEVVIDGSQFIFTYEGSTLNLPIKLLELENLSDIINPKVIEEEFSEQEIKQLYKHLPEGMKNQEGLNTALKGEGFNEKHLDNFERKIKRGYFSSFREKEDEIN